MILLVDRVTSLRYRHYLKKYLEENPKCQIQILRLSLSQFIIYLIYLIVLPFLSLIVFLEVARTSTKFSSAFMMLVPVIWTRKKVCRIQQGHQKTYLKFKNTFNSSLANTSNTLNLAKANRQEITASSHLHLFSSLFPFSTNNKYLSLSRAKSTNSHDDTYDVVARLPYLASVVDTYENVLCHYFHALRKISQSKDSNPNLFLNCEMITMSRRFIVRQIIMRLMYDIYKVITRTIFQTKYIWQVRVQIMNSDSIQHVIDLDNPKNGYYADPFLFQYGGEIFLFVEEYSFAKSKGVITVFKLMKNSFHKVGVCLEESFHLSFPNVFIDGTDIYMIPESSANNDIRLYKAHNFPLGWNQIATMVEDISAVDTILHKANEKYYLLTSVDKNNVGDHFTNLYIYESCELESSSWTPSAHNPVIVDAERGRNAGSVHSNSQRNIRVAQAFEFGTYGKKICFFEIQNLSLECYSEVKIGWPTLMIPPDAHGHHHLSTVENIFAFDFSKFRR